MHRERSLDLWYRNRALDMRYLGVPGGWMGWGGVTLGVIRRVAGRGFR